MSGTIDTHDYRKTISLFATGVTVITSGHGDAVRAMTANAVTSLSLDPILLIVCIKKTAHIMEAFDKHETFCINILHQNQKDLSTYFAGGWKDDAPPPFEFLAWEDHSDRLDGCIATLGCNVHKKLDGGDHWIILGAVVALNQSDDPDDPLIYFHSKYRRLATD